MDADDCTQRCSETDDGQTVLIHSKVHFSFSSTAFVRPLTFETYAMTSSACWYLRSDGRGCYMGRRAVLGGRHATVLLLLILLLTLYTLVLCQPARRAVGGRRERWRRRRQIFQLVRGLLHLHHRVAQKVDGVRQRRQDELKALLGGERRRRERQGEDAAAVKGMRHLKTS